MQHYHKLVVWKRAHDLALHVHRLTAPLVRRDTSGLVGQIRRAAGSVPANIAEGRARDSDRAFARHLDIAIASVTELENHLEFAVDAGLITRPRFGVFQNQIIEVRRMLCGLVKRLRATAQITRERKQTTER